MTVLNLLISLLMLTSYSYTFSVKSGITLPWDLLRKIKGSSKAKAKTSAKSKNNLKTPKIVEEFKLPEYQELFANMKLDHFDPSDPEFFKMRVLINIKHYKVGGPILFYCGNEGPITDFWDVSGFLTNDLAKEFNGIVIFAEHRFFGKSWPRNQTEQDYDIKKNKFLTVEQALTDFAVFLQSFVKEQKMPSLTPIIAFGGSYGGMLAAWGRMKFPHVFAGAVASSAPILLFEDIKKISNNFFKIVTNTYERYDQKCPGYIRQGFKELFNIRNHTLLLKNKNILDELNRIFKPCTPITSGDDIKKLEATLEDGLVFLAQYNYPYDFDLGGMKFPGNPAKVACTNINSTIVPVFSHLLFGMEDFTLKKYNLMENSVKENLRRLKVASDVFFNNTGELTCLPIGNEAASNSTQPPNGWEFLACSEMIMPMESNGETDMFNPQKWDEREFSQQCMKVWNSDVRPTWAFDFFGGRHFAKETRNFNNIFFINGKMDPWNAGCPQTSHNPKVLTYLADSAHHLDLRSPNPNDPKSMTEARKIMVELIKQWILEYITEK